MSSIIFLVDNDYVVLDRSVLRRGSIEQCGEKCNIDFHGVTRAAVFCESGHNRPMLKMVASWRDGVKTVDNQRAKEVKRIVTTSAGKQVTVPVRPKRQITVKMEPVSPKRGRIVAREKSMGSGDSDVDEDEGGMGGSTVADRSPQIAVKKSNKEKRVAERAARATAVAPIPLVPVIATVPAAQSGASAAAILSAISTLGTEMKAELGKVHDRLGRMEGRVDRLEDLTDEIADGLEQQRTLVKEVATATPEIVRNVAKTALSTAKISERLPVAPPGFRYRYLKENEVGRLDKGDFLVFGNALDEALFTKRERRLTLSDRDQEKVDWLIKCLMYRRRFSVGENAKVLEASLRKRLNSYAQRRRKEWKEKTGGMARLEEEEEEETIQSIDGEGEGEGNEGMRMREERHQREYARLRGGVMDSEEEEEMDEMSELVMNDADNIFTDGEKTIRNI